MGKGRGWSHLEQGSGRSSLVSPVLIAACLSMYIRVLWVEPGGHNRAWMQSAEPLETISEASPI